MRRKRKIFYGIAGSALVILAATFLILRHLVTKSFPTVDGQLTLKGLEQPVTVLRDKFGVPHIFAANEHDLFFAQGYVHAQDRLWQMDVARRAGEGRLSEIFGSETLQFDKMLRTIGFKEIAESLEQNLHPESREILQAYADGVNAYINSHRGKYPIEFDMLNYEPEQWKPVHSLMISRLMAWELNVSWYVDLTLGELVRKLGIEKAQELFPTYPENAPIIVPKGLLPKHLPSHLIGLIDLDRDFRRFFGTSGIHIGSNAWAVAPEKSVSGKAMIANDPHLGLSLPSKWYEIHLKGGRFDVAGVSLPGTPLVVIGNNDSVAWGMTSVMADDADFYIEQQDSTDTTKYFFKGKSEDYGMRTDTIKVKDSPDVVIHVRSTIHGPVVNDINPTGDITQENPVTLRWTGQDVSDEIYSIFLIDKSRNWEEFKQGVKEFTVPGQNFVYADAEGNIGFYPGVRLPIRPEQNPTLPQPGWTGESEWKGFVPFNQLPSLYDPPDHFIATANNKTTDNSYPYFISNLWEPPSRIERIDELLQARDKLSVEDFEHIQMDYYSYFAKDMIPFILHAYDSVPPPDSDIQTALSYFRNWNYQCTKDDVPTTLFHVFLTHLLKDTYEDDMGDSLFEKYIFFASIPYRNILELMHNPNSDIFDDVRTPTIEHRDDIIRKSMDETIEDLRNTLGGEIKSWQWGRLHTLTLRHPFGSRRPLNVIFNIGPFSVGGSGTTVNNGEYRLTDPYAMTLGPSMRRIVDFSDLDNALSVLPSGESGQVLSAHYSDQTSLWLNGAYHTMPLDSMRVLMITKNHLKLLPASNQ
jgi:penicillin G amidase